MTVFFIIYGPKRKKQTMPMQFFSFFFLGGGGGGGAGVGGKQGIVGDAQMANFEFRLI